MKEILNSLSWSVFWLSLGLLFFAVWATAPLPLMDMVEWSWQGYAGALVAQGVPEASAYSFKTWPVPNAAVPAFLTLFAFLGSPFLGAKLLASLFLLWAAYLCWKSSQDASANLSGAVAVSSLVILVGTAFFNGYLNFGFGLLAICTLVRALSVGWQPSAITVALLAIALFFTHAIALAVLSVVIVFYCFQGPLPWSRVVFLIPAYAFFLWFVFLEGAGESGSESLALTAKEIVRFFGYKVYTVAKTGPYHQFFFEGTSQLDRLAPVFWVGAASNFLWVILLCAALITLVLKLGIPAHRNFSLTILALLLLFLVLPQAVGKVVNPGERFLMMAAGILFIAGHSMMPSWIVRGFALLSPLFLVSALSLAGFATSERTLPTAFLEPAPQSLRVFFVHYPDRSAYRYRQYLNQSNADQIDIRFKTGLLH